MTQAAIIVSALRQRPHTTWELMQLAGTTCAHKRVRECERSYLSQHERIERTPAEVNTGHGKRMVTLYTLVTA